MLMRGRDSYYCGIIMCTSMYSTRSKLKKLKTGDRCFEPNTLYWDSNSIFLNEEAE